MSICMSVGSIQYTFMSLTLSLKSKLGQFFSLIGFVGETTVLRCWCWSSPLCRSSLFDFLKEKKVWSPPLIHLIKWKHSGLHTARRRYPVHAQQHRVPPSSCVMSCYMAQSHTILTCNTSQFMSINKQGNVLPEHLFKSITLVLRRTAASLVLPHCFDWATAEKIRSFKSLQPRQHPV